MGDGNTVEFIPGISSISVADIPRIFFKLNEIPKTVDGNEIMDVPSTMN